MYNDNKRYIMVLGMIGKEIKGIRNYFIRSVDAEVVGPIVKRTMRVTEAPFAVLGNTRNNIIQKGGNTLLKPLEKLRKEIKNIKIKR